MIVALTRYVVFLPLNLLFVLLSFILSPFLAALSMMSGPVLPGVLRWFSTLDDTLDGGQHQHPEIYAVGATGFKLWWQRTCWICRNPAHGFQCRLLGFPTAGHQVISVKMAHKGTLADPSPYFTTKTVMRSKSGKTYFSYRADKKLGGKHFVKIWIGWNPQAYDGVSHNFEFQPFAIKRL